MAKKKVEPIDKNEALVKEIVDDVAGYEEFTWGTIVDVAEKTAKLKDEKFKELVNDYIQLAYDSGQAANLLEDLLKEI